MKRNIGLSILLWALMLSFFSFKGESDSITENDVKSALHIMGLDMEKNEIDSLIEGIEGYREGFTAARKISIANEVSPSLVFNPLPIGFQFEKEVKKPKFEEVKDQELPDDLNDLAYYSIPQLATLIKNRKISSVQLTQFFLERLKKHNQTLHCLISLTEERALKQAIRADEELAKGMYRGMLHGIPYGAKDLLATSEYKTTWGANPFKDQSFDYDATVISKLEEAGAVLVAKLTLGALAWGDVWYGEKTRNPWDPDSGSSGSSAGSACAVAAGLVPFAIGTETLGSIVSPSTVCGTTGLRPTFGRVSKHGAMALSWSMDKIGPICRSTEDCAIVFEAIMGADGKDQSVIEAPFNYDCSADNTTLKVAYLKSVFESDYGFKKQDSLLLIQLEEAGYDLIPIELPEMPSLRYILTAEAAAAFDELTRSGADDQLVRQIKNAWPNVFRAARFIPAVEYIQANRIRSMLIEQMDSLMQTVDLYITPSWAGMNLYMTNLTGHPQLVMPNGYKDGKPTSVSIVGRLFDEATLLRFGKEVQNLNEYHLQHPVAYK